MKKKLLCSLLLGLLTACGSDSDTSPEVPDIPNPNKPDFLVVDVKPDAKFTGNIYVTLGRFADPVKAWLQSDEAYHQGDHTHDKLETGVLYHVDERDAALAGIVNEPEQEIAIDAEKMHQLLMTNPDGLGAGSARADIFVAGQYSVFDALRYLALTRDDIKLENVIPFDKTGRDTYEFEVSWDCNGDSIFDESDSVSADPDDTYGCGVNYNNYKSKDWHFRFTFDDGVFRKTNGTLNGAGPQGELPYERMDQMWLTTGMNVRLQSFSPEMTQRRQWVQDKEMVRLEQNNGKVIVPSLSIIRHPPAAPIEIVDLEVKPHNMRPDIFQPGVITKLDTFLSAIDRGVDIGINYWPNLSTGAKVDHFGLFRAGGVSASGAIGWTTLFGERTLANDFNRHSSCDFSDQGLEVPPEHCRRDWQSKYGGNALHLMTDVWVMNQPVEYIIAAYKDLNEVNGPTEYSSKERVERDFSQNEDGSDIMTLQTFSVPEVQDSQVLKSDHFGWGIADCTECHNENREPLGHGGHSWPINSSDGFEQTQPYYCASCHGNNGAPEGHGETARCFWCHDADANRPAHHGDASTRRIYEGEELKANDAIYNHPNEIAALPLDRMGNYAEYEKVWSSVNSDWDMSKTFPDPYSCVTCHQNPQLEH